MQIQASILLFCCLLAGYGQAQSSNIDSLQQVVSLGKRDKAEVLAYNELADEYSRQDFAKARLYLANAIAVGKELQETSPLSSSYSELVHLFQNTGKLDSAVFYLSELKELTLKANAAERDAIGANYYAVAALFYKKTGEPKQAVPLFQQAIGLFIKVGNKLSAAGQLLNLGNTYMMLGNYQQAAQHHLKALQLFEEVGSERGKSFCYQSLSISFTETEQYSQALFYSRKSVQLKTVLNDKRGLGTAQSALGDIYLGLGNYDKAFVHFKAAMAIAKELKLVAEEQANYFNIAKVYIAKGDKAGAITHLNQSKLLARQLGDTSSVTAIDAEMIALQNNTDKITASETKLATNLQFFEQQGNLNRQVSGLKNMVDFYTVNKQFDKALEYTNKYYAARDSIRNNDLQLQIKRMEEQYNLEKKEKEIDLLKKDQLLQNASIQRQNIFQYAAVLLIALLVALGILLMNRFRLRQRMKELELRNRIAADLHDEVGSSLSSIYMLSQMAEQKETNAAAKDILHKMSSNAHETMEVMSDIVWMVKPNKNDTQSLKARMERFVYEVCNSRNIECHFESDGADLLKLSMQQRKNTYLIFKEAVNNAVKYAGTEKLDIHIAIQNHWLRIQIKDYGKGFDENVQAKGNGLDNMLARAKELKGNLQIYSRPDEGTEIKLAFPVGS